MGQRSKADQEAWIAVEIRAPRWAVWCVSVGALLVGMCGVVLVALRW